MLKIRLQRVGRAHEPAYRLVLTDSKNSTKSGKYLENLGNYDSRRGEKSAFKTDRITHWISVGAQVSPTVHNMLISQKVISGKKINNLPLKKAIVKEVAPEAAKKVEASAPAPEAVAPESVPEVAPETSIEAENVDAPAENVVAPVAE